MPPNLAEQLRRALRDHFRAVGIEVIEQVRGMGPRIRLGHLEVSFDVVGRRDAGASALGHLALYDPLSRDLGPTIPEEDGGGREKVVWWNMLANQVGAWLECRPALLTPPQEWAAVDKVPLIAEFVGEAERQVRAVRPPTFEDLPAMVLQGTGSTANAYGVALYLAVRGRRTEAVDLLERAAVQQELQAGLDERRRPRLLEEADRLRRFTRHLAAVPVRA